MQCRRAALRRRAAARRPPMCGIRDIGGKACVAADTSAGEEGERLFVRDAIILRAGARVVPVEAVAPHLLVQRLARDAELLIDRLQAAAVLAQGRGDDGAL